MHARQCCERNVKVRNLLHVLTSKRSWILLHYYASVLVSLILLMPNILCNTFDLVEQFI